MRHLYFSALPSLSQALLLAALGTQFVLVFFFKEVLLFFLSSTLVNINSTTENKRQTACQFNYNPPVMRTELQWLNTWKSPFPVKCAVTWIWGEWIHVWLSPFAVYLKLSQHW